MIPTPNSGPGQNGGFKGGNTKIPCKFGEGCTRRTTCTYFHSDF